MDASTSHIHNNLVKSTISVLPSQYVPVPVEKISEELPITGMGSGDSSLSLGTSSSSSGTINLPVSPANGKGGYLQSVPGCPDSFLPADSGWSKSSDFDPCITANVPNTIYEVKSSNIGKIYGSNFLSTNVQCGTIYRKVFCNADRTHKPANLHIYCNDPLCPICYKKYAARISARVSERVMGYKSVYPGRKKLFSLIFWPKFGTVYESLDAAFDDGNRMLKDMGATGAVTWIHPYRIKKDIQPKLRRIQRQIRMMNEADPEGKQRRTKGFWEMAHEDALCIGGLENYYVPGVHFHAQASGYLEDIKKYAERTGAGYKKKGYLDTGTDAENHENIQKHAYYLSTHANFEPGKDTVRYFGLMSKYNLRRTQTGEYFDNVKCDVCGSTLADYEYNAETKELSKFPIHSVITRKIKVYRYWIKGKRPLDSPSEKFLSAAAHKKELRAMLEKARAAQNQKLKGWD